MFTWICPQCGREVSPAYTECPDCAHKTAQPEGAVPAAPPVENPSAPPPPHHHHHHRRLARPSRYSRRPLHPLLHRQRRLHLSIRGRPSIRLHLSIRGRPSIRLRRSIRRRPSIRLHLPRRRPISRLRPSRNTGLPRRSRCCLAPRPRNPTPLPLPPGVRAFPHGCSPSSSPWYSPAWWAAFTG